MSDHLPTPTSNHLALDPIRRRIAELRRHLRRRFLLDGALRVLAVGLGMAVASFVFDRLLDLPIGVRAVILVAAGVAVVATIVRRVAYPLSIRLDDEDLAIAIEGRWPDLKDRLISSLQLARQVEDPDNEESPTLIHALLDETADLARQRRFDTGLSARSLRVVSAVLAGLLLVSGITVAASPDTVGIWARRALLSTEAWPRDTHLIVVGLDGDRPIVVTRGDDLTIVVEARGQVPEEVNVHYRAMDENGDGEGEEDVRRMYRLPETENRFQFEFREIPRSFTFTVSGGDDDDEEPVYEVRALIAPSVESIAARCTFPAYTRRAPEVLTLGDIEVPGGTVIDFEITTNMLMRSARFAREGAEGDPMEFRSGRKYGLRFTAGQSFQYSIRLEGPEGQRNRSEQDTYRVTAVPDRRPEVRLLTPASRDALSPTGLLALKVLATDNYGVESLSLLTRLGTDAEPTERPIANATPAQGVEVVAFDPVEVRAFVTADGRAPQDGDVLLLRAVGRDNNGLEDRTEEIRIEITAPEEIERRLGLRQISLKEDAAAAETMQKDARRAVEVLLADVEPGKSLERAVVDRLRDAQILQGRVGRKMEEFLTGIQRVLNGYVFNRLGNPIAGQAILERYLEYLASDREDLSRVFKPRLYDGVVDAFRRGEIFDPEILGILIQLIEVSGEIANDLSPRSHRIISSLVRAQVDDPAAALHEVAQIQAASLVRFASLMNMMKRWETYHEFVVRMRELEDLQFSITERARQALEGR